MRTVDHLLSGLIKEEFAGGLESFSLTMRAFGVGGLRGAIGLLAVDRDRDRRPISSWLAAGYGVIGMLAALNHWAWVLPRRFVPAGVAMTASSASANTLMQPFAPAHLRGQTVSLFMLAIRGGPSPGALMTGAFMHPAEVREALLFNGLSTSQWCWCSASRRSCSGWPVCADSR